MDFLKDLGPFILAVVAVIINGVPQLLYAQARGFALKPAGFAYLIGGLGNLLTGSVTPISSQAETITVASVKKNLRDNVSSILLAAVLMIIIAAFGGISKISDFAGVAIISGMMSGVGLMLAGVSLVMLNIGANISFGGITASIAGTTQNYDHLSIINSLADFPSALFGGPPIEAIISGTAGAPWPVACGIVFMLVTGVLVLTGVIDRLGKYLPSQSIAGFLLVIGFALTFAPNLSAVAASDNPMSGYIALGVTAWSKNPFLGMVVGIAVRYLGAYVGLV